MEGYVQIPCTSVSLYVGDLDPEVTEKDILGIFSWAGPVASVRLCRDKQTQASLCYAYVNFYHPYHAYIALYNLNYAVLKGRSMRVMWCQRDPKSRKNGIGNVFVKNLDQSVTSAQLHDVFSKFGTVISCKVAEENGMSKGFGFVQFDSEVSATNAINALHGTELSSKKLYVAKFLKKNERGANSNLFVTNLDKSLTENQIGDKFSESRKIHSVVLMKDDKGLSKGFGFVNFELRDSAAKALKVMNGEFLGSRRVYLSWAHKKSERREPLNRSIGSNWSYSSVNFIGFSCSDRSMNSSFNGSDFNGSTKSLEMAQWGECHTIDWHKYGKYPTHQFYDFNNQQPQYNYPQYCASAPVEEMSPSCSALYQSFGRCFTSYAPCQAQHYVQGAFYTQPMKVPASSGLRQDCRYSGSPWEDQNYLHGAFYTQPVKVIDLNGSGQLRYLKPLKDENPCGRLQNKIIEGGDVKGFYNKPGSARRPFVRNLQPRFAAIGTTSTY